MAVSDEEFVPPIFISIRNNKTPYVDTAATVGELVSDDKKSPIDAIEATSRERPTNIDDIWPKSSCVPNNNDSGIKVIINKIIKYNANIPKNLPSTISVILNGDENNNRNVPS